MVSSCFYVYTSIVSSCFSFHSSMVSSCFYPSMALPCFYFYPSLVSKCFYFYPSLVLLISRHADCDRLHPSPAEFLRISGKCVFTSGVFSGGVIRSCPALAVKKSTVTWWLGKLRNRDLHICGGNMTRPEWPDQTDMKSPLVRSKIHHWLPRILFQQSPSIFIDCKHRFCRYPTVSFQFWNQFFALKCINTS